MSIPIALKIVIASVAILLSARNVGNAIRAGKLSLDGLGLTLPSFGINFRLAWIVLQIGCAACWIAVAVLVFSRLGWAFFAVLGFPIVFALNIIVAGTFGRRAIRKLEEKRASEP